jgi:hypothetical protein
MLMLHTMCRESKISGGPKRAASTKDARSFGTLMSMTHGSHSMSLSKVVLVRLRQTGLKCRGFVAHTTYKLTLHTTVIVRETFSAHPSGYPGCWLTPKHYLSVRHAYSLTLTRLNPPLIPSGEPKASPSLPYLASRRRAPTPKPAEGEFHTRKPSTDGELPYVANKRTNRSSTLRSPHSTLENTMVNGTLNPTSGEPKAGPSLPNPKVFCHRSHPRIFPNLIYPNIPTLSLNPSGEPKASPSLPNPIQSSGEPKASPDPLHLSKMVRVLD